MAGTDFVGKLKQKFGQGIAGATLDVIDPWIDVTPEALPAVCRFLHDDPACSFTMLSSITVVDYCEPDAKKAAKVVWQPHLEVVYHLWSVAHKRSLVLKVHVPRWKDDVPGRLPEVPSVCGIWRSADWLEREAFDLSGIDFTGHPDLRRILCAEDWEGYPLRKDYEFPLEYHGIRGR